MTDRPDRLPRSDHPTRDAVRFARLVVFSIAVGRDWTPYPGAWLAVLALAGPTARTIYDNHKEQTR